MKPRSSIALLALVALAFVSFPTEMEAFLINKDVYQSFADPQDNFEVVLEGDWRNAETDPDKVISPFEGENVNISYDAANNQTTVSFFGPEIQQNQSYPYHFGFGYGISQDHDKIIREYWTRAEEGSDVPGGSFGYIYDQETGTVEVLLSNDTYHPTIISDVGFLVLDGDLPLDVMDRENYPPEAFEPSGIPDGTRLEPGEMWVFTIEGVAPHNAIMTYQTVEFAEPHGGYLFDVGEWVQVSVERDLMDGTSLGVEEHGAVEPAKFLEVNSFSENPEINYQLPQAAKVTLTVYSVAGERVATLVDGTKPAGSHTVRWDTSEVPAGLYFCRLSADGICAAEKMIRLK